jgi:hypothetical protein
MTYTTIERDGAFYAVLDNGAELGSFPTLDELERDLDLLTEHVERGAFVGKAK